MTTLQTAGTAAEFPEDVFRPPAPAVPNTPGPVERFPLLIVFFGVSALILTVVTFAWGPDAAYWGPGFSTLLAWSFFATHIFAVRRHLNAFDPLIWVPVLMLAFYFGMPIGVGLAGADPDAVSYDAWGLHRTPPQLERAFAVALLCLVGFLAGSHLAGVRRLGGGPYAIGEERKPVLGASMCLMLGGAAMLLAGVIVVGPGILFGAYGDMTHLRDSGARDFRLFGTGILFCQAGIFGVIACHDSRRPFPTFLALLTTGFQALILLLTGDRGGISCLVFGFGWAYTLRVRRVPVWLTVAGFIAALIFVPVVGELRKGLGTSEALSRSAVELVAAAFYEMGSTLTVFAYTMHFVPAVDDYDWGLSYVAQFAGLVPNFGLSVTGHNTGFDPVRHLPSVWLTFMANPAKFFNSHAGYGFAFGAEWYFNFGIPGVLLGMTFSGWLTAWLRNHSLDTTFRLFVAALFLAMMMLVIRNAIGAPARLFLWPMVGLLIIHTFWPAPASGQRYDPSTHGAELEPDAASRTP